jgi:hypothetical protein
LLRQPFGGRVESDSDVEDFPVDVLDHEEDVKRFGGIGEAVYGPVGRFARTTRPADRLTIPLSDRIM